MRYPTLSKQREVIRFCTFKGAWNQGEVVWLGDRSVFVEKVAVTVTKSKGCCSSELIDEHIETVVLNGRRFIIRDTTFRRENDPKRSVTVPFPFVPSMFLPPTCIKCGQNLPSYSTSGPPFVPPPRGKCHHDPGVIPVKFKEYRRKVDGGLL